MDEPRRPRSAAISFHRHDIRDAELFSELEMLDPQLFARQQMERAFSATYPSLIVSLPFSLEGKKVELRFESIWPGRYYDRYFGCFQEAQSQGMSFLLIRPRIADPTGIMRLIVATVVDPHRSRASNEQLVAEWSRWMDHMHKQ